MILWVLALSLEPLSAGSLALLAGIALTLAVVVRVRRTADEPWTLRQRVVTVTWWSAAAGLAYAALQGVLVLLRWYSAEAVLSLDPAWPWPIVVALIAALLWLVLTTYPPRLRHLPVNQQRILLGLRLAGLALLVYSMLRPSIQWTETDKRSTKFAIVTDLSRSMNTPDMAGGSTRIDAARKMYADQREILQELGKIVDLEYYDFDRELRPQTDPAVKAEGDQTAIGAALAELLRISQSQRIACVLMSSDFAQRALPPQDADPRSTAQRLAELQIPVHTIPLGSSSITGASMDLIAEDLQISPTAFVKNQVLVGAKIRALGAIGREFTVRLMVEKKGKQAPGESAEMELQGVPRKLRASGNEEVLPVELSYVPKLPGEYKITLEVIPLEGELVTANNALTTFITVLRGGINVAYFDTVRPEQKFVRRLTESPDIQLDFKLVRLGKGNQRFELEPDWFKPGRYDVFLIGDIPARVFQQPGAKESPLEQIKRAVERGAGLMMTGGFHNYGAGGYADTPLADVLPVVLRSIEVRKGDEIDPTQHYLEPLQMLPAEPLGSRHFVMRLETPDKNLARWRSLAPLEGANRFLKLKPGAQILAETVQHVPLLVAEEFGQGRSMAFAADTTYQWVLGGQNEAHQRFWRQIILWLAKKETQGDNAVWVRLSDRRFRPGQPVEMTLGARGADGLPVADARFKVEVQGPKGKPLPLLTQSTVSEHSAKFLETQEPGEYQVRVEAEKDGKSLGPAAQARWIVYEQDLELNNPAADFALAEEISKITGGSSVPPEQLGSFLRRLIGSGLNAEVKRVTNIALWDNSFVILAFVTILSVEWFWRKRRGLV